MRARWFVASLIGVVGMSVVALPCWTTFLSRAIGRFVSVEQLHLVQYAWPGGMAALSFTATSRSVRRAVGLGAVVGVVGFADELIQLVLPHRVFQWSDVCLNWSGSLLGFLVVERLCWLLNRTPASPPTVAQSPR